MSRKVANTVIFLNASVVLAGLKSPKGGSAKILAWSKTHSINTVISEIVFDEIIRNSSKIGIDPEQATRQIYLANISIRNAPPLKTVQKYQSIVIDDGDAHVLASCEELHATHLVTLDKKHLLILRHPIKWVNILSPGEFIEAFSQDLS